MGGRGNAATRGGLTVTEDDWMDWASDPEPFQAVISNEQMPEVSQADGHRYTKKELDRIRKVAPEIQRMAEEGVVDEHTLFRGESFDSLLEARRKYKIGKVITNDKMTSYAVNPDIAKSYAEGNIDFKGKDAVKVVITNTNINPKVSGFVGIRTDPLGAGGSNEIISPRGMKSKVVNTYFDENESTLYVRMETTASPKRRK